MSKAQLKKTLKDMDRQQLADMIVEMYDARKEFKAYLEYWLDPDPEREFEKSQLAIHRLFFIGADKPRKAPAATSVKKTVADFSMMCYDAEKITLLMLYVCECYCDWMTARRFGKTVSGAADKWFESVKTYIESSGLEAQFGLRFNTLRSRLDEIIRLEEEVPSRRGMRGYWRFG